jgi:hypothetical protein
MNVTTDDWTDLADRESDRIAVTLHWSPDSGRVKVAVADRSSGESFEIDVPACDALDAYYHPFAYAARPSRSASKARIDTDLHVHN